MKFDLLIITKVVCVIHICFDLVYGRDSAGSWGTLIIAVLLSAYLYITEKKEKKDNSDKSS